MNNRQYKLSETQLELGREWDNKDLLTFTAYFKINSALSKCRVITYDYDTNFKLIKKNKDSIKHNQSMISEKSKKQHEKESMLQNNLTKSARPKVETIKKLDIPLFNEPSSQLISKISPLSNMKQEIRQDHSFPFFISEHSNIPKQNKSNSLKIVEQNTQKFHNILNDTFSHQEFSPQQEEQHEKIFLPMLQKTEHNQKLYLGEKAKNIETLNQFLLEPSYKDTSKFINNKIDKNIIEKSSKKQKTQGVRIPLPQSHQKIFKTQYEEKATQYINGYKIVESRLVQEIRQQKSKSKSKPKKVKDSSLYPRKPKFKQPIIQHTLHPQEYQIPFTKQIPSQSHHEKLKPSKSIKKDNSNKLNAKTNKNQIILVADYDEVFDKSREIKSSEYQEEGISQFQQNIQINQMPQVVKHNVSLEGRSKGSQSCQSNKFQKVQIREDPHLQFFAIPLQKIKQNKPSDIGKQQVRLQKLIDDRGEQMQQNLKQEIFKKKESGEKSSRKKIFSQTQKQVKQKSQNSIHIQQYTEQQMRMILGAKGNKYKQMIIKQYIRISRATNKQNSHE